MKQPNIPFLRQSLFCTAVAAFTFSLGSSSFFCLPLSAEQPALAQPAPAQPLPAEPVGLHRIASKGMTGTEPVAPEPPQASNNGAPLKDDLFAGTEKFSKNATEANEVDMDPDSLNIVDGPNAGRAHRTLLNVVHHYEYDKPGMYNMDEVNEFRRKITGADWHCSVRSRDLKSGESTDICSRRREPDMVEQAIITVEPKELTFIHTIRRANGQGSHVGEEGFPGVGMVPGLGLGLPPEAMSAMMQAQILASTVTMRAEAPMLAQGFHPMPLGAGGMNNFKMKLRPMPKLDLKDFKLSPEQQRQMQQHVEQQMKKLELSADQQRKMQQQVEQQMKDFKFSADQQRQLDRLRSEMDRSASDIGAPEKPEAPEKLEAPEQPEAPEVPEPPAPPAVLQ